MKLLIAQINPTIGDLNHNVNQMLEAVAYAKQHQANVVLFPELAVSGYPPKDLLFYPDFVDKCLAANTRLIEASVQGLLLIWGNIARNTSGKGKPLFNAGYCAYAGGLLTMAYKSHLPTYDVFDEARYFQPGPAGESVPVFDFMGQRLALTICEDLWSHCALSLSEKAEVTPITYETSPLDTIPPGQIDTLINLSASPYIAGKPALRAQLISKIAAHQQATVVYVNQVGANDDLIFDGASLILQPDGKQWFLPRFENDLTTRSLPLVISCDDPPQHLEPLDVELIKALTLGIRDYVHKSGFSDVFIGLSGGMDSSFTAALATEALGAEHVIGISMPGPYSSHHSIEDAEELAQNLGITCRSYPIQSLFESFVLLFSQGQLHQDLAEQNLQARLRGLILMTLANREHGLVLTTGNKSELATGYSTLYGDTCGALAPLGDLFKTQVYQLAHTFNQLKGGAVIPQRVFDKPPSAELAPNQKDEDSLLPYPVLDPILKGILEDNLTFEKLCDLGYDAQDVQQTFSRVMGYEYKRKQMPPSLKVSSKAFGSGRMFPVVHNVQFTSSLTTTKK